MSAVFITGAAKNTGLAIAEKFASEGFGVALSSRSQDSADTAAKHIADKYGVRSAGYALDLADVGDIKAVFAKIKADFRGLDTFVANSADLGVDRDILSVTQEDYDALMNVNLRGTYFCCQQAALAMKAQNRGSIVVIGSVHSKASIRGRSLYSASKGGLDALVRSMAIELGAYHIRVNCVVAGAIRTDRWDALTDEQIKNRRANWPLGLESTGEDIANGAYYLGSDLSKTVTGTDLTIDSGILVSLLPFNGGRQQ